MCRILLPTVPWTNCLSLSMEFSCPTSCQVSQSCLVVVRLSSDKILLSVWQQSALQVRLWITEQGDQALHNLQGGHHALRQPGGFRIHRGWLGDFALIVSHVTFFPPRPCRNTWKRRSWGVYQTRRSSRLSSRWSSPRCWGPWRRSGRFTLRPRLISGVRPNFSVRSTRQPRRRVEPGGSTLDSDPMRSDLPF